MTIRPHVPSSKCWRDREDKIVGRGPPHVDVLEGRDRHERHEGNKAGDDVGLVGVAQQVGHVNLRTVALAAQRHAG